MECKEYTFKVTMKITISAPPGKQEQELDWALSIFSSEADVDVQVLEKELLEVKNCEHPFASATHFGGAAIL